MGQPEGARPPRSRRPPGLEFASLTLMISGGFTVAQVMAYSALLGPDLATSVFVLGGAAGLGLAMILAGALLRTARLPALGSGLALVMAFLYAPQALERPSAIVFVLVHLGAVAGIISGRAWLRERAAERASAPTATPTAGPADG